MFLDWLPTFAFLAGVSITDDPPTAPLPVDPADPQKNIYGEHSFPPLDGVNVWPMLMQPAAHPIDAAHKQLVLTKEVLIAGQYKLLVAQPFFKTQNNGWKDTSGSWGYSGVGTGIDCESQDLSPKVSALPVPHNASLSPCLFDLRQDPSERHNIASQLPAIVAELWAALNKTILGQRDCSGCVVGLAPPPRSSCCRFCHNLPRLSPQNWCAATVEKRLATGGAGRSRGRRRTTRRATPRAARRRACSARATVPAPPPSGSRSVLATGRFVACRAAPGSSFRPTSW